jgi:hypothetical protein
VGFTLWLEIFTGIYSSKFTVCNPVNILSVIKKVAIAFGALLLLLSIGIFITLRYYEDDVANYAFKKIQESCKTKVDIGKIDLAFWSSFPRASVELSDVYIEETFTSHDTLFASKRILLEFNLFDLFRGNYKVKEISAKESTCHLRLDKKSQDNWHFWNEDSTSASTFEFGIHEINLESTSLTYEDASSEFYLSLHSKKSGFSGNLSSSQFDLATDFVGMVNHCIAGGIDYLPARKLELEADLKADINKGTYKFNDAKVKLDAAPLLLSGNIELGEKRHLNMHLISDELDLEDLLESIPANYSETFRKYKPSGELKLDATLNTELGKNKIPIVDIQATINDGEIQQSISGASLENVFCEARYTYAKDKNFLSLKKLNANLDDGYIEANGTISMQKETIADLHLHSQLESEDVRDFFNWDTLEVCEGQIIAEAHIKGTIAHTAKDSVVKWNSLETSGQAQLSNGKIRIKNSNREFTGIEANMTLDNNTATVQQLKGLVNGSDFLLNGTIGNFIPYFTSPEQDLIMTANFHSNLLDFTNLIETTKSTTSNQEYKFNLPKRIRFTLNSSIDKFQFRKFEATNVKGVAQLQDGKFFIDPVSFGTSGGNFVAQLSLTEINQDLCKVNVLAKLEKINISQLFVQFENFDQQFIQDKNLKGEANATVQFRTQLTSSMTVLTDKIESLIDISIDNGELVGLESLQEIATYLRENKWVAPFVNADKFSEKMKDIKFSHLENSIDIKNRVITIPNMEIKSSAMDISIKGKHTYDNQIDYTVGFNLRDILLKKEKEWQEADDGLGREMFIFMRGSVDNPSFGLDKAAAQADRKQEVQEEKQNVKALLKEEFGLFKKDKEVGDYKEKKSPPETSSTTIEWDGFDNNEEKKTEQQKKPEVKKSEPKMEPVSSDKPKKKIPKWLQEKE